ncbi:peptidase S8/S53 domain-containing protein [Halteromyces radiatus]|uniref:peptidase S8/S53 domain-containing protein n=1 Tax=Halteromyces radiatus TaxID=101107 RepID=UPI002220D084|nr:peptidase S8/S53 domain-containing protein [Halteromyces radiatus]KAI8086048.1 peptidase S8/S53 domain-containing protein [Halteromyces radiatus]
MQLLFLVAVAYLTFIQAAIIKRDPSRQYYTLHFPQGHLDDTTHQAAKHIAQSLNTRYEGPVGELKTYFLVSQQQQQQYTKRASGNYDPVLTLFDQHKKQLSKRDSITSPWVKVNRIDKQVLKQRSKRAVLPPRAPILTSGKLVLEDAQATLGIKDPGFDKQWHLVNLEHTGNDINVTSTWKQGVTGKGIIVAILDDGLDYKSRDLKDNFYAEGSYDFNDHVDLPTPILWNDYHGTRCAGQIAAVKNDACGVGIAYDAKVSGIRILSGEITDVDEAAALNYKYQENDIFSCSWGPPDDGKTMEAPNGILADAFINGIENGRGGKGTVYVFATGNGGDAGDNCNFDGYTNSIYTITVGALDHTNHHPSYAERCSAQLVVTYSSGGGKSIYTTNHGHEECTDIHGGTSAAAPNAAGIFALVLSVRPDLTWRDMQHLCVQTALPVDLEDDDWKKLPSGRMYNHKYGYGKLDTWAIVEAAKVFKSVNKQTYLELPVKMNVTDIPDTTSDKHKKPLQSTIQVSEEMINAAGLSRLEHITATINIEHQRRGDVQIILRSPNNVESELAAVRSGDASADGIRNWKFMTVKHWEEDPIGNWTLLIYDEVNAESTGRMLNWTMTLFGELDPTFEGEPDHQPNVNHDTTNDVPTSIIKTTPKPTSSSQVDNTHAPVRPTRVKPTTTITPTSSESTIPTHLDEAEDTDSVSPGGSTLDNDDTLDYSVFIYAFVGTAAILGLATGMYFHKRKHWRSPSLPNQSSAISSQSYEFQEFKHDEDDEDDDFEEGEASDGRPLLSQQEQLDR